MKTTIDMAREVYGAHTEWTGAPLDRLEQLVALVRADEREQGQKWFDAVTAQHKQLILAEREACAKLCDDFERAKWESVKNITENGGRLAFAGPMHCAAAIRARGNT
jgi:hypothetical protein